MSLPKDDAVWYPCVVSDVNGVSYVFLLDDGWLGFYRESDGGREGVRKWMEGVLRLAECEQGVALRVSGFDKAPTPFRLTDSDSLDMIAVSNVQPRASIIMGP